MIIVYENGKPVNPTPEMSAKIITIDTVLKSMGYPNGYNEYTEAIKDMTENDFTKYIDFIKRTS